ncbi:MAG: hypothetical protein E5X33_28335 [Mesorhizobium sp.]|uniref:hypothetical protein n=1 Tax=Mesorhizobium sp. TaxID=1871066 RepID=UPI0012170FBD|nr:hypothetical protein [Mesorhizobium sp.]TIR16624.1 MAG: hypothetical protein E5X33_28335 [Mesorhizobium sp.]
MAKALAFDKTFAGRWHIVEMDLGKVNSLILDLIDEAYLIFRGRRAANCLRCAEGFPRRAHFRRSRAPILPPRQQRLQTMVSTFSEVRALWLYLRQLCPHLHRTALSPGSAAYALDSIFATTGRCLRPWARGLTNACCERAAGIVAEVSPFD